ncbi:virulence-associated E family protein, partial [Roseomonas marmotae]
DPDFLVEVDEDDDEAKRLETIGDSLDVDRLKAGFGKATSKGEMAALVAEIREKRFSLLDQTDLIGAYSSAVKRITGMRPTPAKAEKALRPSTSGDGWLGQLEVDQDGRISAVVTNAVVVLSEDPVWRGVLAYDELARSIVLMRPIPIHGEGSLEDDFDEPQPWSDDDTTRARIYLQRVKILVSQEDTFRAVRLAALKNHFNPLVKYLKGLVWDGKWRLDTWLIDYCKAEDTQFVRDVGRMTLLGAVARAFNPGCKLDNMLVLEGDQGARKSTAIAILGGRWFSDSVPPLEKDEVRLSMSLHGKWIIEHAEMASIRKPQVEEVKSFLTRQTEEYVPKYGRVRVREPRSCIFIGSCNPDGAGYLRDPTGARRFWPVKVGDEIDTDALRRDRDQLFAEAEFRLNFEKEPYWPSSEWQRIYAKPEQEKREEEDDGWIDLIRDWLEGSAGTLIDEHGNEVRKDPITRTTTQEVLSKAVGMAPAAIDPRSQSRAARAMTKLGWVRKKVRNSQRYWVCHDYDVVLPPSPEDLEGL